MMIDIYIADIQTRRTLFSSYDVELLQELTQNNLSEFGFLSSSFNGRKEIPQPVPYSLKKIKNLIIVAFLSNIIDNKKGGQFLIENAEDFMKSLSDADITFLTQNTLKENSKYLLEKNIHYQRDLDVFLWGNEHSGVSSIYKQFWGYSPPYVLLNYRKGIIPIEKYHEKKMFLFAPFENVKVYPTLFDTYLLHFYRASNALYVIDSTDKKLFQPENNAMVLLKNGKRGINKKAVKNIAIIANKQDLPGAATPQTIEKEFGIPTYGFSATAPDRSDRLRQIICEFLAQNQ